jgi:opacity protein-like surface antigen
MRKRGIVLKVMVVIVLIFTCSSVYGQDEIGSADKWDVELTPYFWAAELKGDATLRGRTGSADVSFSDILDNLDIAFMGRVEGWKGRWGLYFDGLYMDLGTEFTTPRGSVSADADVKMTMLDFGIGHRVWETKVGQEDGQKVSIDLLGGGRYMNLGEQIDVVNGGPLSDVVSIGRTFRRREEWVEPVVGGRLRWDLNDKLAAGVRADFGGFDIGNGSNLSWNLIGAIDYELKDNMNLKAGYRIFDIDYDSGSGNKEFGLDAQFRGPIFGLTILF